VIRLRQEVRWTDLTYEQIADHLAEAGQRQSVLPVVQAVAPQSHGYVSPQSAEVQGDGAGIPTAINSSRTLPGSSREYLGSDNPDREHGHQRRKGVDRQLLPGPGTF